VCANLAGAGGSLSVCANLAGAGGSLSVCANLAGEDTADAGEVLCEQCVWLNDRMKCVFGETLCAIRHRVMDAKLAAAS
jgi:hypothetical protein